MLQISNIDDAKSEWNINETHMIIPMIDGDVTNKESEKILTSTLTLNALEGGDQTILTNALEHSLVIGLEKNLFETPNYKSDLVLIQNSDLKLLSCNTDLKNSITYTLSYVDQDKSEILWQSPKDRICGSDKAILEVRDVLNYDELEKNEQQINLECIGSNITSQETKTGGEILTEENTVGEERKESQFVSFYSSVTNNETVSILPNLDASKFIQNIKALEVPCKSNSDVVAPTYKLGKNTQKNILNTTKPVIKINNSIPIKVIELSEHKTCKKPKTTANRIKDAKNENTKGEKRHEGVSNILPEKSLPLKKKAKMKRTVMFLSSENQRSLLKQDTDTTIPGNTKSLEERIIKKLSTVENEQPTSESSLHKVTKRRRIIKPKTILNKPSNSNNIIQEEENKSIKTTNNSLEEEGIKVNFYNFDKDKFNNIFDLVECLRKCRMINATVWQTLNSGLKEMEVDILKEMNEKTNEKYSKEKTTYSPQLKAFALVVYFKQPAAFNHLAQVYKTGWPSLNVIKEWKRQMNSHLQQRLITKGKTTAGSSKS